MSAQREYPETPRVGVGAVILNGDSVLLVKRGSAPSRGKWSIPGGLVQLGETTEAAAIREVEEECGLRVRLQGIAGVVDRIVPGDDGRIRYHYVLVDFLAAPERDAVARAGSDAAEVRWVPVGELDRYDTTEGLRAMVLRAMKLREGEGR
jgi:ADP-ribose pyrophosphatase YjhB (NUDIX family)